MDRFMRRPEVRQISGLSDSTIDRLEKLGDFPRRCRIGPRSVGWPESQVIAWLENRSRR